MPTFAAILDKTPVPASSHIIMGHMKGPKLKSGKSWFTSNAGADLELNDCLLLLMKARDQATMIASKSRNAEKAVGLDTDTLKLRRVAVDDGKLGMAVSWGVQTGLDGDGVSPCTWIVLVVTKNLTGGRHQWVTAFPAVDSYVQANLV